MLVDLVVRFGCKADMVVRCGWLAIWLLAGMVVRCGCKAGMVVRCGWLARTGFRADFRFTLSQWEMVLLCNNVSHWLGASLESALGLPNTHMWRGCIEIHEGIDFYSMPHINSLWHSDAIWGQISGSILDQVMACRLMARSHYLNQCWLFLSKIPWHSSEGIIMKRSETANQ